MTGLARSQTRHVPLGPTPRGDLGSRRQHLQSLIGPVSVDSTTTWRSTKTFEAIMEDGQAVVTHVTPSTIQIFRSHLSKSADNQLTKRRARSHSSIKVHVSSLAIVAFHKSAVMSCHQCARAALPAVGWDATILCQQDMVSHMAGHHQSSRCGHHSWTQLQPGADNRSVQWRQQCVRSDQSRFARQNASQIRRTNDLDV